MKSIKLLSLTLFILIFGNSYSQTGWSIQNVGTTSHLHCIHFPSANTGYIAGWASEIIKTTDGGNNWFHLNNPISIDAQCVFFVNNDIGWIIGGAGKIEYTSNGGTNWIGQTSGFTGHLYYAAFFNSLTGVIVGDGGKILKTTNGGVNWNTRVSGTTNNLVTVFFADNNIGWIGGDFGTFLKTTNGGENWSSLNPGFTNNFGKIYFIDTQTGWLTGANGLIMKTTNGGNSWVTQVSGVLGYIMSPFFVSAQTGYIAGNAGVILKTTNGGDNWFLQNSNTINDFRSNFFFNALTGYTVGYNGTVVKTTNGGISLPVAPTLISPVNNSVDITLTPTLIWSNIAGSNNYTVQISTTPNFIVFSDSNTVTNTQYTVPSGKLLQGYTYFWRVKASNGIGSSSWSSVWNFATHIGPEAPTLISPANGATGILLSPILDWGDVNTATSYFIQVSLNSSFSLIVDSATLTTSQRTIPANILNANGIYYWRVRANNSSVSGPWSTTWNFYTVTSPTVPNLISPPNYAINQSRTPTLIWDSVSSATSYTVQISTVSNFIVFVDSSTVTNHQYAVPNGKLFDNITYFWRVKASNQYGSSSWSVVWRFTVNPTFLNQIGNVVPEKTNLYQNYPNPFNPATKIKFDIAENTFTNLSIYDITGKKIETILNSNITAGKYECEWSASRYNSGIYFARLISGKEKITMKMFLIK